MQMSVLMLQLKCEVQNMRQDIETLNSQVQSEVLSWLDSCSCEENHNWLVNNELLLTGSYKHRCRYSGPTDLLIPSYLCTL